MTPLSAPTALPDGPPLSAEETTFRWMARPFDFLDACAAAFADLFTLHFTRFGTHVVLAHPDDVREVLTGNPDVLYAGRGNTLLEPILGRHSLLLADGERHLRQRALLQPAFRGERVQSYAELVAAATRKWTASWDGGGTFRVQRTALDISREVILRLVLGIDDDAELAQLSRLVEDVMLLVATNATFDEPPPEAASPAPQSRLMERFRAARAALNEALQEHVEQRRRGDRSQRRGLGSQGGDVLSMLLEARSESGVALPDEEIRDQLVTMILAGHETTASSITWALLCLDSRPEAREPLLRELAGAADLPDHRLAGLPYLQATCLETLRLRPVIPVVSRQLQRPFRLRQWTLPAGIFVTPCPYLAHRRPEVFADPETFRPERFLEGRFSPYEYFPFGGGAHRCIGMSFALLELQIVVGMLARRFRFAAAGPVRGVRRAVTVVASGGGKMHVERRSA